MAEKYLNLIADINLQVQKAEQTPNRINSEINTKRHCDKTSENWNKEKSWIVTKKQYFVYMGKNNISDGRILIRTKGKWHIFVFLKEMDC